MNDTLIVVACIAAAILGAMAFTSWRIKRLQYPPHLRWPTEKERRRAKKKAAKDDGPEKTER
ncbi:MAG: hypothetical protein QNL51_05880 [Opitutaceae bacterium]